MDGQSCRNDPHGRIVGNSSKLSFLGHCSDAWDRGQCLSSPAVAPASRLLQPILVASNGVVLTALAQVTPSAIRKLVQSPWDFCDARKKLSTDTSFASPSHHASGGKSLICALRWRPQSRVLKSPHLTAAASRRDGSHRNLRNEAARFVVSLE